MVKKGSFGCAAWGGGESKKGVVELMSLSFVTFFWLHIIFGEINLYKISFQLHSD